jgi:hypothetical protein
MDRVVQQINLYRGIGTAGAAPSGGRSLLVAGIGALLVVTALAVGGELYLSGVQAERAATEAKLRSQQAEIEKFKQRLATPPPDPFLEAELAGLRETQARLNANLAAVARHGAAARPGFAAVFTGLARNTLDGIWLDRVGLAGGGAELHLAGQTVEPALVPRLLQTLASEQAFAGRAFRQVTFERRTADDRKLVDFELRSAPSREAADAG